MRQGFSGDPTHDWNEAVFLHHLRRYSRHQPPPQLLETRNTFSYSKAEMVEPRTGRGRSQSRDHLVPEVDDGGVLWRDTSLPLSLAENSECEELYLRGLTRHPMYKNTFHRCNDHHEGTVTLADQVTMLLNLLCNFVLRKGEGLCCGWHEGRSNDTSLLFFTRNDYFLKLD